MTYGHAAQTYEERQSVGVNLGEELFLKWCSRHQWDVTRLGFDEKGANVGGFYNLNRWLRNLPDFVIEKDGRTFVVNVKGTANIKGAERAMIPGLTKIYASDSAPLLYAFAIRNEPIRFASADQVMYLYDNEFDKTWSDGKVYRTLDLNALKGA